MHPYYPLARAARYWGVPPWELMRQPAYWTHLGAMLDSVDREIDARSTGLTE